MSLKQRFCVLQHVPFEGPAAIGQWIHDKRASLSVTKLFEGEPLPSQDDFDWLIIMGGPMGVYDTELYPWLVPERRFILETIESGKNILGICLGAQLIAAALGAEVKQNKHREIGWFNIQRTLPVARTILSDIWPENIEVFHWHGDTFDIPQGATRLASSDACDNQGFIYDSRVVGLQFHLEMTTDSVISLIENCQGELDSSEYVQSEGDLVSAEHSFAGCHNLLYSVLERLMQNSV